MTDTGATRLVDGKVALVTGGSRGVGAATARLLAAADDLESGATVYVGSTEW